MQAYSNYYYCAPFFFINSVNKQINDKERVAAALENPNLKEMVDSCIRDEE